MNRLQRVLNTLVERVDTPAPIVLVDIMQAKHRPHARLRRPAQPGRQAARQDAQVCGDRSAPGRGGAVGITAGNVGEAEVFAAAGFDNIFLAYPIWPAGTKGEADPSARRDHPAAGRRRQHRGHRGTRRRHGR